MTACLPHFLKPKAEYHLIGIETDEKLMRDMSGFLEERADAIEPGDKKDADALQQEAYHEQQLHADLLEKLRSEGYYDATLTYADSPRAWTGTFTATTGTRYTIHQVTVTPDKYKPFLVDILPGRPLDAPSILAAQEEMFQRIAKAHCFFNLVIDHEVTLDTRKKQADVLFKVSAGPEARLGAVTFKGNNKVRDSHLQKLVDWKDGDCFQQKKIDGLRTALFESGLFSGAEITVPEQPPKNRHVPVTLTVTERAPRSIQAGVSYYTDEGPGVTLGWKHRNLFGAAESLDTSLKLSQYVQTVEGRLTKPFFLRKDQSLSFNGSLGHEETDGYTKNGIDAGIAIQRVFNKRLSGSTGVSLSISEVEDDATRETNNFYLLSLPQSLTYDSRDRALDARRGFFIDGHVEPFFDAAGESASFIKTDMSVQAYHALSKKITAALRVKAGSIIGPGTLDIPAPKRFYAGGGGSIRGFGYQQVGPLENGEPAGGRSLAETSAELRFKVTDSVGVVAFIDAGTVGNTSLMDLKNPSVGAGAGLRYYTDFAPLRLDIGIPLNNKETTSSSYQVYISIGQAF